MPSPRALSRGLPERLAAAGAREGDGAFDAWRLLHEAEGPRATVIDLYELVAAPRGIAAHELPRDERLRLARLAMPVVWPGFAIADGSERGIETVELLDYDERWPAQFASWQERIVGVLPDARVEHVGSTSVPGLPAKPTIDIQVSVAGLDDEDAYVPPLESLELRLRSRDDLHRYFRPPSPLPCAVHVHVCERGSRWERDHPLFRDYLRAHAAARDEYARTKREAARDWADDRIAYTDAKSETILAIMQAAEEWAAILRPATAP
jgi:GrpB-like predicted nucleotidyltransferase (UPF0157 family)